jgi:iron complex outermembrane receptor protein
LRFLPQDRTATVYSAFGQDEIEIRKDQIWLTIGSKFERNDYTHFEVQPSVRGLWSPTADQSVWGGVTRAVRMPSRLERDFQLTQFITARPLPTFIRVNGSDQFDSEFLIGYEAGYRNVIRPDLYLDVAAFHNHHDNLQSLGRPSTAFEAVPPPLRALLVVSYDNGVAGTSNGLEIAPDWRPTRVWQVRGSYSYVQIDVQARPGHLDPLNAVPTYEGSSPRHQASVRSLFTFSKGWQFDQTLRYASALRAQFVNGPSGPSIDAYLAADVHVGWQVAPRVELSLVGQNLTRSHHFEFGHSPGPAVGVPRSVFASVTWNR